MNKRFRILSFMLALSVVLAGCSNKDSSDESSSSTEESAASSSADVSTADSENSDSTAAVSSDKTAIENALNLANMNAEWTYSDSADAWTMASVSSVTNPEIEDEQGVSVCVPGAYVKGIDTTGDGEADTTSGTANGTLV
ncbi:MAG: hypothetical protein K5898_13545, partial [Ruminococcus sp.]|uniref:hypothetical protein n=1 Tax=Ruminococcus sp. TaxID=41978 RepID=UPI002A1AD247|nr:hypothetical protein [Ruminococcus sp.]